MSIMYCDRHDRRWDSDYLEECPRCLDEGRCPEGACLVAEARGPLCACTGECAYAEPDDGRTALDDRLDDPRHGELT